VIGVAKLLAFDVGDGVVTDAGVEEVTGHGCLLDVNGRHLKLVIGREAVKVSPRR
jgi:hypothetical protein